ncbi:MAG: hypothetical protein IPH11_18015 [Ignavibacteriales bacterium]|nr:hypothetical protein [Ignavibacteriales bacterium]
MTLHDLFHLMLVNRVKLLTGTAISAVIIFLFLFLISPVTFNAPVSILPPQNTSSMSGLGGLLSGGDFTSLLTGDMSSANSEIYIQILKSRTAGEYVVNKFKLKNYYDVESTQKAVENLQQNLNIDLSKEGIITVSVDLKSKYLPMFTDDQDTLKKFSAKISNSFVAALDSINKEKLSSKAKSAREYIEMQIQLTKIDMDSAEKKLVEFQKKNKAISLPEQVEAVINAAAQIKTQMIQTEVEIGYLQNNLKSDNKTLLALNQKLNELTNQYNKMEMGNQDYLLAFSQLPELGKELADLMREVKIQNEVYLLLQQQYYKEKIQENKDIPTIEVLDKAIPPLKAVAPRTIFSTAVGAIFVFLFLTLILILKEKRIFNYTTNNRN